VRDDDNGFSLFPHPSKDGKEFINFLGSKDCRRLVKDKYTCVTIKGLEKFDTLLLAH
jgi:hypothetical protein